MKASIYRIPLESNDVYAEGHALTAPEAEALNRLVAENVCHIVRPTARAEAENRGYDPNSLNDEQRAELVPVVQEQFTKQLETYQLGQRRTRSGGGATKLDPVVKEARVIARELVALQATREGRKIEGDERKELVKTYASNPKVVKEAEKRVASAESMQSRLESIVG